MMRKMGTDKRIILILGAIIISAAAFIAWFYASGWYFGPADHVVVALPRLESSALLWIAQDQGFFSRNGLNVTLHEVETGLAALDQLEAGKADIAGVSEFPVVEEAINKKKVRTIGCIDKAEYMFLIGRRDRGIEKATDLAGKRVGIIPGTILPFYLGRFLELRGLNLTDVSLVDLRTSEFLNAMANGSVDAVVVGEPVAGSLKDRLGEKAAVWQVQSSQPLFGLLVSGDEWTKNNPRLVTRFLRSLVQAEEYLTVHPPGAKEIMKKRLNVNDSFVQAAWSRNQFGLSLDESLITAMEDEERWMIKNNLTRVRTVPNFRDYTYIEGLEEVLPGSVNIVG